MHNARFLPGAVLLWLFCHVPIVLAQLLITTDKPGAVYKSGEPVRWQIEWKGSNQPPQSTYSVKKGGLSELAQGELKFSQGIAGLGSRFDAPGTLLLEVKYKNEDGRQIRVLGGAVADPGLVGISAPKPKDFDRFWRAKLRELKKVPANPQITPSQSGKTNVIYEKLTLDNIRGSQIQGQLARPVQGGKLPALLIVQWAGVYPLQKNWATDRAAEGWLVLNIQAHDLPIDQPESFYKAQFDGPLKNYWSIGNDNRETSYFLRMYLSCFRAADYLTRRPDWNRKTLVVMGGSQGGLQALMTAGLHPKISAALASVPAGCDMLGPDAGRSPGWPMWYNNTAGKDPAKVRDASRYYDVANFTPHIKCPVLVGIGMIDEVCPPAGVLAAMNLVLSAKELVLLPRGAHQDDRDSHRAYNQRCYSAWLPALLQNKPAPVRSGL